MELNYTVEMMTSTDYKERFKAEYYQLKIRYGKLMKMLKEYWDKDELDFTPDCPRGLYTLLRAMHDYLAVLEARAKIEGIELEE